MMARNLKFGKWMVLLLAALTPVLIWQAWSNRKELMVRDLRLRDALSEERNVMMRRIARGFFEQSEVLELALIRRTLPDNPLEGLPEPPDRESLLDRFKVNIIDNQTDDPLIRLLRSEERFFSGMPQRYAGMAELLKQEPLNLTREDADRLADVSVAFYWGEDLSDDHFRFLITKMGYRFGDLLDLQKLYLGLEADALSGFLVNLSHEGVRYLLNLPDKKRLELNGRLEALDLDLGFETCPDWKHWDELSATLTPQTLASRSMKQTDMSYAGITLVVELLLLLVFSVLDRYERINHSQTQLLATTSHELRTPVAVIRQFAEMLIDRKDRSPERFWPWYAHIHRESMKMQFLVENLLGAARFENLRIRPKLKSFSLKPWITEIVEGVARLSDEKIKLQCPDLKVSWDADQMSQVVVNLLENARVHARTAIDVRVRVEDPWVIVSVRDWGKDANPERLRKIKAFKSGKATSSGLGLGLYLVKRIVEAHEGFLTFEAAKPGLYVIFKIPQVVDSPSGEDV